MREKGGGNQDKEEFSLIHRVARIIDTSTMLVAPPQNKFYPAQIELESSNAFCKEACMLPKVHQLWCHPAVGMSRDYIDLWDYSFELQTVGVYGGLLCFHILQSKWFFFFFFFPFL